MADTASAHKGRSARASDRDLSNLDESRAEVPEYTFVQRPGEAFATVGHSMTMAISTQFGREKAEVSTWISLPCSPDMESLKETHATAKFLLQEYHDDTWEELEEGYFPDLAAKRREEERQGKT